MPQQSTLADYRSYSLPGEVDLPDASVSQVPLYATRTVDCERTALFESGNSWLPPHPMLNRDFNVESGGAIVSTLKLQAFDSMPAGYLRVLTADKNGTPQFIGEGRINDEPVPQWNFQAGCAPNAHAPASAWTKPAARWTKRSAST